MRIVSTMSDASEAMMVSSVCLVAVCVALLAHHRYKHRTGGPHELHGTDRWFQKSDICNFHSCSHEMWIILLFGLAVVLFTASFVV